jgi:hypothetical protein
MWATDCGSLIFSADDSHSESFSTSHTINNACD